MATNLDYQSVLNLKKSGRYTDPKTKGLQLLIKPSGAKYWLLRFALNGKRQELGLGSFPEVLPKQAREQAQEARVLINRGINPIDLRNKSNKSESIKKQTFEAFALDCITAKKVEWSNDKHINQWTSTLQTYAFPTIGNKPLDEIDTDDILEILTPIWVNKTETASRLRGRLEWILAAATTRKLRSGMNPALWRGHLQTILPAPAKIMDVEHHKALPYRAIPGFIAKLREIDNVSALALEFTILNASRTGEVIGGLRAEIDDGVWTIPASRMKARKEHRVPLCERSIEILAMAKSMGEDSPYLFSRNRKPLSNMAMPMMLRRMGVDVTVHGFRSTFRDWVAEETMHSPEVAEMALAHTIRNKVEAAYRRSDLLERRRMLMNDWAKYCFEDKVSNIHELRVA
jgi:integrase